VVYIIWDMLLSLVSAVRRHTYRSHIFKEVICGFWLPVSRHHRWKMLPTNNIMSGQASRGETHPSLRLCSHWHEYESRVWVSVYGSYKLHPYEWAFMVTYTRTTQRVSTDNLQKNWIERMLCEKVTIFRYIPSPI